MRGPSHVKEIAELEAKIAKLKHDLKVMRYDVTQIEECSTVDRLWFGCSESSRAK